MPDKKEIGRVNNDAKGRKPNEEDQDNQEIGRTHNDRRPSAPRRTEEDQEIGVTNNEAEKGHKTRRPEVGRTNNDRG